MFGLTRPKNGMFVPSRHRLDFSTDPTQAVYVSTKFDQRRTFRLSSNKEFFYP